MKPFESSNIKIKKKEDTTNLVGYSISLFLIITSFYWVTFYSFNPVFVQAPEAIRKYAIIGNNIPPTALLPIPDVGRCYIASIICSILTVFLLKISKIY
jgi:hypothetical protein